MRNPPVAVSLRPQPTISFPRTILLKAATKFVAAYQSPVCDWEDLVLGPAKVCLSIGAGTTIVRDQGRIGRKRGAATGDSDTVGGPRHRRPSAEIPTGPELVFFQ